VVAPDAPALVDSAGGSQGLEAGFGVGRFAVAGPYYHCDIRDPLRDLPDCIRGL